MFGNKQGEYVKVSLVSADASAGVSMVVADANGVDRPIAANERLVLDSLLADVFATGSVSITDPGAGVSANAVTLAGFTPTAAEWHTDGEGLSLSVGSTPKVTASGAGAIVITGTGRVLNGKSQGVRPNWRELLTPGGNVGGI